MMLRRTGKEANEHHSVRLDGNHFGHRRVGVLVAHDDVRSRLGRRFADEILGARMGVAVDVFVVVVDPQVPLHDPHRVRPGLGTGAPKHESRRSRVAVPSSGSTMLKWGRRKLGNRANPVARRIPNADVRTTP